jgi:uroporphyrinogen decarboxylase
LKISYERSGYDRYTRFVLCTRLLFYVEINIIGPCGENKMRVPFDLLRRDTIMHGDGGVRPMAAALNARENINKAVSGGSPDWIPFTLDIGALCGFTKPVLTRFRQETGSEHPEEYFDFDYRTCSLGAAFGGDDPRRLLPDVPRDTSFDEWGIGHWAGGAEATYEKMFSPLAGAATGEAIDEYPQPRVLADGRRAVIDEYHRRGYAVFGYAGSIYEWSWWLRGMQRFMEDTILRPEIAHALTRKVAGYVTQLALASAEAGIDVLCFYDDVGMQTGMQISPHTWRRFVKPYWSRVLNRVRCAYPESFFFLHSCGDISEILQDILELGFHVLHPLQPECMDFSEARERFGKDILLCGTVSAQRTLPFGTADEVRREVAHLRELCSDDNRLLLCPSNMIQPETPWENVIAFVEEARAGRLRNSGPIRKG